MKHLRAKKLSSVTFSTTHRHEAPPGRGCRRSSPWVWRQRSPQCRAGLQIAPQDAGDTEAPAQLVEQSQDASFQARLTTRPTGGGTTGCARGAWPDAVSCSAFPLCPRDGRRVEPPAVRAWRPRSVVGPEV